VSRILILVNGAQEHRPFYARVGDALVADGHEVQYALDSHYTDVLHPDVPLGTRAHYFSDYLKEHYGRITPPTELEGANLWTAFFPDTDRMMYTRFMRRRDPLYYPSVVANLGHFFAELFDRYAFDAIVYENVSNAFSYMAYEVGTRRGARWIGFAQSRMPGRLDILDRAWARDSRLQNTFQRVRDGALEVTPEVRAYVDEYMANLDAKVPDYVAKPHPFSMGLFARYARRAPLERFTRAWKYALTDRDDWHYAFQVSDPIPTFPEQLAREAWRQTKARLLRGRRYRSDVDLGVPYFAYPLQFHPESSASVDGVAFNDEWNNIEQTARCLPFGVKLYVKDHKHAAGRQSLDFYDRVARIPNVELVDPNFDTKTLLRRSKAVVVSTSTMGFEALLLQRPVFVLGHPFYEFVPGCVRIDSFDRAFETFARHATLEVRRPDIEALLAAYYLCTEKGYLDVTKMYGDPTVTRWIADIVARKTEEHVRARVAPTGRAAPTA
jgi:hypothetical protein